MKLEGLEGLYKSMKSQGMDRSTFDFNFRGKKFDVIYFIDETPHKLAIGVKSNNFYFEIDVRKGFIITPLFGEKEYSEFCRVMEFKYSKNAKFSPAVFFNHLNKHVPVKVNQHNIPKPHDVAKFRRNVEEADKIYFVGWLDNKIRGNKVSKGNLEKTRQLLSKKAYEMCKEKNVSSRWSDICSDTKEYNTKDLLKNY
jgi:Family of unknown function (DUF6037)